MNEFKFQVKSSLNKAIIWLQQAPLATLVLAGVPLLVLGGVLLYIGLRPAALVPPDPTPTPTDEPSQQALSITEAAPTAIPADSIVRLAWFYKPPEGSQLDDVARDFNFFILTYKDENERDQLKTKGASSPFAQYLLFLVIEDPGNCQDSPKGNQVAYKAGDFCQISEQHPDWFLLDQNGQRIKSGSDTYHMDPGSEGYRQFWLERARELQETYGWDNIFLDNVEASRAKILKDGVSLPKYPDDRSYQQAVQGFMDYIRQNYFGPAGKMIYGNIISQNDDQVWDSYLRYLDGAMIESFATDWSDGFRSRDDWEQQMEEAERALARGKTMVLVAQGEQKDQKLENFAFASYLLIADGNAYFRYTNSDSYRELWWYENYDLDLGKPLGKRFQDNGVWQRDFEKGTVTVNPQKHEAEIVVKP